MARRRRKASGEKVAEGSPSQMKDETSSESEGSERAKAGVPNVLKLVAFRAEARESGAEMDDKNTGSADGSSKRDTAGMLPKTRQHRLH